MLGWMLPIASITTNGGHLYLVCVSLLLVLSSSLTYLHMLRPQLQTIGIRINPVS